MQDKGYGGDCIRYFEKKLFETAIKLKIYGILAGVIRRCPGRICLSILYPTEFEAFTDISRYKV